MTTLREAAQQALEALEALDALLFGVVDHYELDRRKQALRAALAQEEQTNRAQQMRDAGHTRRPTLREMAQQEREDIAQNLQSRLDAALLLEGRRQEIAQPRREPEQEPVATVAMDVSGAHLSWNGKYLGQKPDTKIAMLLKDLPVGTLLFTAPPRREWRGLTEEEIYPLYSEPSSDAEMVEFARAIEQALRSKNHE